MSNFKFAIDRGGTFTDVYAEWEQSDLSVGPNYMVSKLLSEDPSHYADAPREGIRRVLEQITGDKYPADKPIDTSKIQSIRMGTTVATNALLERKGERTAFLVTRGFKDILRIGNQSRMAIFDLEIARLSTLYDTVVEIDERVRIVTGQNETEVLEDEQKSAVQGVTGETVLVLKKLDLNEVREQLLALLNKGIKSIAVSFAHSYTFRDHEEQVGALAAELGFTQISLSSSVMPMVKLVPRSYTTCADAYLTPCIKLYLQTFCGGFDDKLLTNVNLLFMQSDGGLADIARFTGSRAILSGPAGGVVGYALTTKSMSDMKNAQNSNTAAEIIGFDMGGTSTDVSRYDGKYEHIFENTTAGITIQAPQLDISTVAAGGGSMLFFRSGIFVVGPESAGANPGPACYRKGGPLTITDANLFLGRLLPEYFPHIFGPNHDQPLDRKASVDKFETLTKEINEYLATQAAADDGKSEHTPLTPHQVAYGFLRVANESMCRPIRALTQARGFDITRHTLACFGGAGGQHAVDIAWALGMRSVYVHKFSGILSAFGMGLADVVHEEQVPCALAYIGDNKEELEQVAKTLDEKATSELLAQGFDKLHIGIERYFNMRYDGTDTALMIRGETFDDFLPVFLARYKREYGFTLQRGIVVDDIRVRGTGLSSATTSSTDAKDSERGKTQQVKLSNEKTQTYFEGGFQETCVYQLDALSKNCIVPSPAIIMNGNSTILVPPGSEAWLDYEGDVHVTITTLKNKKVTTALDNIQLSIFGHRFMSVAEQMGKTLQRTSISTNIKERLDFSCALFGPDGGLVANAPHLPVHLGAMQEAVRFQVERLGDDWRPGDVVVSNHPTAGGSHLPDITVITPVFAGQDKVFFVASRGHHSDIGGISPGSMPPFSKTIFEEGAGIVGYKLVENHVFNEQGISDILNMVGKTNSVISGTRNLKDNLSDLRAQVAANQKGIVLMEQLIAQYSLDVVQAYMKHIQQSAESAVRDMLCALSLRLNLDEVDVLRAEDFMDDGSLIKLAVTIDRREGTAIFDFSGTASEVYGNTNAPKAVTASAVIYCLRCLVQRDIPLNQGCMEPVTLIIPEGSILNPSPTAAVVGGNVLTSQRVTDVVLKAFGACAASQGCMNNLTFGDAKFGYYETIAGGAGAGDGWDGQSGVHTHMTNTRITDVEILERRYPVHVREFSLRPDSGGDGLYKGGDGVVRDLEFLRPVSVGILSERRSFQPYGLKGGLPGARGINQFIDAKGHVKSLGGKNTFEAKRGDRIRLLTPGGGGYGLASDKPHGQHKAVARTPLTPAVKSMGSMGLMSKMAEQQ